MLWAFFKGPPGICDRSFSATVALFLKRHNPTVHHSKSEFFDVTVEDQPVVLGEIEVSEDMGKKTGIVAEIVTASAVSYMKVAEDNESMSIFDFNFGCGFVESSEILEDESFNHFPSMMFWGGRISVFAKGENLMPSLSMVRLI